MITERFIKTKIYFTETDFAYFNPMVRFPLSRLFLICLQRKLHFSRVCCIIISGIKSEHPHADTGSLIQSEPKQRVIPQYYTRRSYTQLGGFKNEAKASYPKTD